MASGQSTNYIDFGGGVNAGAGRYLLAENQGKAGRNFKTTPIGSLKKRNGFSLTGTVTTLDSIHSLFAANTSTKYLIAVGKQASASSDRIVRVDTSGTLATLKSGLTLDKPWEWAQAPTSGGAGPIYGLNGTDTPQQWDGAAGTTSNWVAGTGTVPSSAKYLLYHTDRLWATGSDTFPGRVWYSGLTGAAVPAPDPLNWDADNYVDIEPQDGEIITAIGTVGPYIVVFKPRNTYVITDPVTGAWRQLSDTIGCIANRSVAQTDRGTIFVDEGVGACVTDGSTVRKLDSGQEANTGPVDPFLSQAAEDQPGDYHDSAATFWQGSYHLSIPYASASNDLILEYDTSTQGWWPHSRGSTDWALIDPVGTPKLYSASGNKIYRAYAPDVFADEGVPYYTFFDTAYFPWGEPHLNKRVRQFRVDGSGDWGLRAARSFDEEYETLDYVTLETTASSGASTSFGVEDLLGGVGTFGAGVQAGIAQRAYFTPGFGRAWSLRIEDTSNVDLEVFSLAVFLTGRTD